MSGIYVYCQLWEESERGWGTRPDGYSLHIDRNEAARYKKDFLQRQHQNFGSPDIAPDEYTRADGELQAAEISVEEYHKLQKDKTIRSYERIKTVAISSTNLD